jgi:hypothetical protein
MREEVLNADFKNILISLNVDHDKEQATVLAKHIKISDDYCFQIQGLERVISEERALLTEAREALITTDLQLSAIQSDHTTELRTLESLLLSSQNEAILLIHTHNEKVLEELKAKCDQEIKQLTLNHAENTDVLRDDFETQIKAKDREMDRIIISAKEDYNLKLEQIMVKNSSDIVDINDKNLAAIDTLKEVLKNDLLLAQNGYTQLVDKLQAVHHQEIHILLTRHTDEKGDIKHQHMLAQDALYTKEISQVEGLLRAQEVLSIKYTYLCNSIMNMYMSLELELKIWLTVFAVIIVVIMIIIIIIISTIIIIIIIIISIVLPSFELNIGTTCDC